MFDRLFDLSGISRCCNVQDGGVWWGLFQGGN